MSLVNTLILLLAVQSALFGAAWGVAGFMLGLPRGPALHWMGFSLMAGVGASLFLADDWLPLAVVLPARNLALLMAVMLVRRGAAAFNRGDPSDLEQGLVLAVAALYLLVMGTEPALQWARAALMSSAIGWVLIRFGGEQIRGVSAEFQRSTGWVLGCPPLLVGAVFMCRAVMALVVTPDAAALEVRAGGDLSVALLVALLLSSTLLQFSLLYIVILRMVRKLERLSSVDELTQLLNRRAWQRALQAERLRLRRDPRSTALLVVDLDHFKSVNDRHGHAQGDLVLARVARCLEDSARGTDVVARLGGEEFALLLPDTGPDGASEAAERLRQAVASLNLTADGERVPLTVSVGVAVLSPEAPPVAADFERLQARADAALYAAKAGGRNLVKVAAPEPGPLPAHPLLA